MTAMTAIAERLKLTVEHRVDQSALYSQPTKSIAEALNLNTSLTCLDLSDNLIDAEKAKVLADALQLNTLLTCLNLYDNFSDV